MFQEQKLPDIGGDIDRHVPQSKYWGTRPPCPIGIDATGQWRRRLSACVRVRGPGHTSNINFDNFELNYNTILQFC